ncbi:TauD/TfdA dioxygenase family protein [Nocardioides sp. Soil796]|uniref:TauD/TfdA dioxygenase family protein n=1 Tax=Nocardioides sp. Soil796 TaxID=1736412 RepID=UPI00070D6C5D|nr:TauD/TfdA family dioxygenase [Nocardioides sp. Soil796]KRF10396.1 taurine dioxygenase [Nocardioides sp. Soil796]
MDLKITPLTGSVGARVEGVSLDSLSDEEFAAIREGFLKHQMLVFRGQHAKPATQIEFGRRFGKPVVTAMLDPLEGHPELVQITKVDKETTATEAWHYDAPFVEVPAKISILSAVTVPNGGDTMWSNQYAAYERLSDGLRATLDTLKVRFRGIRLARMMKHTGEIPMAVHPLVRTHPETGRKALYLGHRENACIDGWTQEESNQLLEWLYAQSVVPDNIYRHQWAVGDLVMWDNRCTMHYAVHDYDEQPRALNRMTLEGEVPA